MLEYRAGREPSVWKFACLLILAAVLALATPRGAAAAMFVDAGLSDVPAEKRVVVAHPQPVQLLVEFRQKGAANVAGTAQVKPYVLDAVKTSGVFSDVTDVPAPNGAILNVVIENVISPEEIKEAQAQGFATGATLFIAGSTVRDHYVCTIDYIAAPDAPKISRTAQHALIMQLGLINSPPPNAVKVAGGAKQAVAIMVRQIVSNPLNELAADPAFAAASVAPVVPPAQAEPAAASPTPDPAIPPPAAGAAPTPSLSDTGAKS